MLKYLCPNGNRDVTTSIQTDLATLLEMRDLKISVWCPHCVAPHQICASEAYLDPPHLVAAK